MLSGKVFICLTLFLWIATTFAFILKVKLASSLRLQKTFYNKILHRVFADCQNTDVTEMFQFVISSNIDITAAKLRCDVFCFARTAYTKEKLNVTDFTKHFGI